MSVIRDYYLVWVLHHQGECRMTPARSPKRGELRLSLGADVARLNSAKTSHWTTARYHLPILPRPKRQPSLPAKLAGN